ncbi:hypothetical protein MCUN1_001547 [Malassezia cuniculi]|uniref:Uncharacterized protein n=1 Tax=Malassezia cuniculi TaxID=948313 RepID=A0AAF0EY11_9BASI|nr:hypothetical protein MCUN1_001547 [Malassezia cuniculi]
MPGASANTSLIIGLCAGLGGGALLVAIAGAVYVFETKRRARLVRDHCVERANADRLAHAKLDRVAVGQEYSNTFDHLYSIPTIEKNSELDVLRGRQWSSSPSPTRADDDVRYPVSMIEHANHHQPAHQHVYHHANQPVQPVQPMPEHPPASQPEPVPEMTRSTLSGHSLRAKMSQRMSLSRLPSLLSHNKTPSIGHRRTMVRHIPRLRSLSERRPARASSAESIHAENSGEIPMARRIAKRESRFTYDASSPSESLHQGAMWGEVDPAKLDVHVPDVAVPEPAVLAAEDNDRNVRTSLYDRIFEWQAHSQQEMASDDGVHDVMSDVPQVPLLLRPASGLSRGLSRSSAHTSAFSATSHSTLEHVIGPYFGTGADGLVRAPTIRPQFAAETTLDSWLLHDDPRLPATPTATHEGLFGEVELISTHSTSDAHGQLEVANNDATKRASKTSDHLSPYGVVRNLRLAETQSSSHSPRTMRSHISTSDTSRSSMRMSHSKHGSLSTEITWPSEGSAVPEKDEWRRSARLSDNVADRVARANRDWGVGNNPPQIPEMPSSGPLGIFAGDENDEILATYNTFDGSDEDETEAVGYAIDPTEEDLGFDTMPSELRNSRVLFASAYSHSSASSMSCSTEEAAAVTTAAAAAAAPAGPHVPGVMDEADALAKDTSMVQPLSPWLAHEPGAWAAVHSI